MNEKKYLIYLDILGFEKLPEEIAKRTGFEEDVLRQNYLSAPLKRKIEEIERETIQISKGISEIEGSDNYVLIVDDVQTAFELVGKLATIKIPHKDYEFIQLEVGLGTQKIDEDIEVKPINRKEIIRFLKNYIISPYRSYHKNKTGAGIKETFVLLTHEFYDDLESLDKKYCKQISYKNKTIFVANSEKIQQRASVFEFLEKIGYAGNKWYGRIDEVYVPPSEFEDMVRTLKEKRVLFITGTQEYGKTYTAVRLMWEYYNSRYEPRWIKGGELAERINVREKLENIKAELKPRHIIYFEDPFGKTKYERRESLERKIGTIIDSIGQVEDVYVIITSREEVFKKFEREQLSARELKEFERKLNLKKSTYDYEKRKEILLKWAEEENCRWLGNKELKELVLEYIKGEKILPTPLSIKAFAVATAMIEKEDELKEKIREKSKETAKAFAEEIKNMTDDKILFLSFLFFPRHLKVEFVRAVYQELVEELNLKNAWEFDRVFNWFKDDKINITYNNKIEFSHPSYSEALERLLVENGYISRINEEIFSKLLLKLSEKDGLAVYYVAAILMNNLNMLPEVVRNELLFKVSERYEDAFNAVVAVKKTLVVNRFDKLSGDINSKLIMNLSQMTAAALMLTKAMVLNLDILTEDVRNLLDDRLQSPLKQVIQDMKWDGEEGLRLISNVSSKLELDFLLENLKDLSKSSAYPQVRRDAAKMLKAMRGGKSVENV